MREALHLALAVIQDKVPVDILLDYLEEQGLDYIIYQISKKFIQNHWQFGSKGYFLFYFSGFVSRNFRIEQMETLTGFNPIDKQWLTLDKPIITHYNSSNHLIKGFSRRAKFYSTN